jgi:hypothetical protein
MRLGTATAPSGTLLIVDAGYLGLWCHDRPPLIPEGALGDPELEAKANGSVDLRIEGPDAIAAGRAFHRQWNPGWLFDIPRDAMMSLEGSFRRHVLANGWKAHLVALPERVTHLHRVELALEHGGGAGYVQLGGLGCVAVGGVPRDRELEIVGERVSDPSGDDAKRWRRVSIECRPELKVARREPLGEAMVDRARLIIADVDALGGWVHEDALDGKADLVFWGRDAEAAAAALSAPLTPEGVHGWLDLTVAEAAERARAVEALGLTLAIDFRPHSHHYQLMAQVRASQTESGSINVGGARMCGFMTTWGDGLFPVVRELSAAGELVRISIELAPPVEKPENSPLLN